MFSSLIIKNFKRNFMNNSKEKLVFLIILLFFGPLIITKFNNEGFYQLPNTLESIISTSEGYNLTGNTIYIDDLDPDHNWNETVKNGWCSGNGTLTNPYILENITIDGEGSSDCISIKNSQKYFQIRNCTLYNGGNQNSGINLYNASNGYMFENDCSNDNSYGIKLNLSNFNTIENNTANDLYSGIRLDHSNYTNILNNTLLRNYGAGIEIRYSKNITICSNFAAYSINGEGIYMEKSFFVKIIDNEFEDNYYYNIEFDYCYENEIKNNFINKIDEDGYDGIQLDNSNRNLIFNNTINLNRFGIRIRGDLNIINKNNLSNNRACGIQVEGENNTLVNNLIENTGFADYSGAIRLLYHGNNTIKNNKIINNSLNGIYLEGSVQEKIIQNTISDNTNGIYLILNVHNCLFSNNIIENNSLDGISSETYPGYTPSTFNTFMGNKIENNGKNGLHFDDSHNNTITNNKIIGNLQNGINASNANYNSFSKNSFVNNSLNAIDNGIGNTWSENGKGNYWDDYRNYDYDEDGIGDIPYNISGTSLNKDMYPLGYFIPLIKINLPYASYNFSENPPGYSLSIQNENITSLWYTIDGGMNNISFNEYFGYIDKGEWETAEEGPILFQFYAKDIFGNIGSNQILIFKSPKLIQIFIKEQLFTEENFNITFQIISNQGQIIESPNISLWWNHTDFSTDIIDLENGTYFISLDPIIINPEEDPIPLKFSISHSNYSDLVFTTYIAVDPDTISKSDSDDKNGDNGLPMEIIIPVATFGSIGAVIATLSIVFLIQKKKL
ncbi:MAG: hypothetical protein EU548_07825 [Promethearchaeota archaeon]|nr:MAG: hypothetical protein EU548_07825 [Candidatus Lokiarchaeota archaeon]